MQYVTVKDERQPTGLPGGDSASEKEGAEQLLGGQSSVTQGQVPKHTGLRRNEPKNERYAAPWIKIKEQGGEGTEHNCWVFSLKNRSERKSAKCQYLKLLGGEFKVTVTQLLQTLKFFFLN